MCEMCVWYVVVLCGLVLCMLVYIYIYIYMCVFANVEAPVLGKRL